MSTALTPPPPPAPPPPLPAKPCRRLCRIAAAGRPSPSTSDADPLPLPAPFLAVSAWADAVQERGMRQRRPLYDHRTWRIHRSSLRHLRHVLTSFSSRVVLSLVPPVAALTAFAAAIAAYNSAVELNFFPLALPILHASSLPYQLTAPALALLLVFRTEASYSRFEEGRKAWAKVAVGAADLARAVIAVTEGGPDDALVKNSLINYIMAFPLALKCHLIYESDLKQDLNSFLDEKDLAIVLGSKHRPRCLIEFMSQSINLLHMHDSKRQILEEKLSIFHEGIGVCEQLMGMPIPLSYTRLTSRFLVLWHLTLPVMLWDDCNYIVIPATFISATSLFCIEEVGVLIEEPFPMLALDELCNAVNGSIREAIGVQELIRTQLLNKRKAHCNEHSPNGRPLDSIL